MLLGIYPRIWGILVYIFNFFFFLTGSMKIIHHLSLTFYLYQFSLPIHTFYQQYFFPFFLSFSPTSLPHPFFSSHYLPLLLPITFPNSFPINIMYLSIPKAYPILAQRARDQADNTHKQKSIMNIQTSRILASVIIKMCCLYK